MALKLFNDSGVAKLQAKDGEESITATADGAVKLYYDNAEKLATTSAGVDVTGDLKFNSGYGSAVIGYGVRAWANFNGAGTLAIRASGNVSSITDNGLGDYTVNFATAMPDSNYSSTINGGLGNAQTGWVSGHPNTKGVSNFIQAPTTTAMRFVTSINNANTGLDDAPYINVTVIR